MPLQDNQIMGKFGVLEDEPEITAQMKHALESGNSIVCLTSDAFKGFRELLKLEDLDAVSIDWELHGVQQGREVLEFLHKKHPATAKLVFSKSRLRKSEALENHADAYLIKSQDLSQLQEIAPQLVILGQIRQILEILAGSEAGVILTDFALEEIGTESEIQVRDAALNQLIESKLDAAGRTKLHRLLVARGWLRESSYNAAQYALLPWNLKLNKLMELADLSVAQVAGIFKVHASQVSELLESDEKLSREHPLFKDADRLISILAYVRRLAGNDLELMPHFCNFIGYFEASSNVPPWDSEGLIKFLLMRGQDGLITAIAWIRNH